MRPALLALVIASVAACSRPAPQAESPAVSEPQAAAPAKAKLRADWLDKRLLPARQGGAGLEGRHSEPAPKAATGASQAPRSQPEEPVALAVPPPFKYVGKVARGGEQGHAVLVRDDRVFVVRAWEMVEGGYAVQSVSDTQVILVHVASSMAHTLAYASGAAPSAGLPPTAGAGATLEDVSLLVHGPTQVAVGEQFTVTVSLDSGFNTTLDTGRVEVRFDPKVLTIPGEAASSGAKRLDIAGAYAGHPAPAVVQFQVVAAAPTATEIRVVPTNIADDTGRDVAVNTPQAHRLAIVRAPDAPPKRNY